MKQSHEVLRQAIERVGAKAVARELRLSSSLIAKWGQKSAAAPGEFAASGALNPLDRIKRLYDVTRELELVNWLCQAADGFFVRNVDAKPPVAPDLVEHTQRLIKEFSETLAALSQSFDNDRRITKTEAGTIRREWEDLKRVGEALVRACEAGRFNRPGRDARGRQEGGS